MARRARADVAKPELEPGSFRDPESRVFYGDGGVLRALSEEALADWRALAATSFFAEAVAAGKIVATDEDEDGAVPADVLHGGVAGVLRHELIPFVSYPYEWPFGMLKDAALLQLELLEAALGEGMILKDSTPYNVQWRGAQPVFVDVGSFERLREGEPWAGYRQFCMLFLYPLLLQAYKNLPFQPWLRGSINGISPEHCRNAMSLRDLLRPGVFTHVHLHSRLERRHAARERDVKDELRRAGFRKELIVANVKRLRRVVEKLEWTPPVSTWSEYTATTSYTEEDAERKARFVEGAVRSSPWGLVWDLGCNDGRHSRIAAEAASYIVAVDADAAVVERLYRTLRAEGHTKILPLTLDVADPSPGLGWRCLERRPLAERGTPDLTLALALVHHVAIAANVPLADFLEWLRTLDTSLVIEFPTQDDAMVERLLRAKRPGTHRDYNREWFERCLTDRFDVRRSEELAGGRRVLYFARPR